jgi:hypothetical protein
MRDTVREGCPAAPWAFCRLLLFCVMLSPESEAARFRVAFASALSSDEEDAATAVALGREAIGWSCVRGFDGWG